MEEYKILAVAAIEAYGGDTLTREERVERVARAIGSHLEKHPFIMWQENEGPSFRLYRIVPGLASEES